MGTYYYAGHTYQIVKTAMTWAAAKAWAESQGGHLAYITSAAENQALVSMTQLTTGLDLAPSAADGGGARYPLSLFHISEPTRLRRISYAVFCFLTNNACI